MLYTKLSDKLRQKYGSKVYKIPISIFTTCPVIDGTLSKEGCWFCGSKGAGYENHHHSVPINEQIENNLNIFVNKYKAEKFILYFQNFTNTYIPLKKFKENIIEGLKSLDNVVGISISTRPDCIEKEYLDFLKDISSEYNIDIIIELGLQSVNNNTLKKLNRGHTLSDYIKSALQVKSYGFSLTTHIIASLPFDEEEDLIEAGKLVSILKVDTVKLHSLYIEKGTVFGDMYEKGEVKMISMEDFIKRVSLFIYHLDKDIAIERLVSRVPVSEDLLFLNWDRSHWVIGDMILSYMEENHIYQGKYYCEKVNLLDKFNS